MFFPLFARGNVHVPERERERERERKNEREREGGVIGFKTAPKENIVR